MSETHKKKIEVFSAGCPLCEEAIRLISESADSSCEVKVLDMHRPQVAERAKTYGIKSVPAAVINGVLVTDIAANSSIECRNTEESHEVSRIPLSLEARWKGIIGSGTARVSNFSKVGCYLETQEQVHNREVIDVELATPDNELLALKGRVVYRMPEGGFGMFFIEVSDEIRAAIARLVEHYGAEAHQNSLPGRG